MGSEVDTIDSGPSEPIERYNLLVDSVAGRKLAIVRADREQMFTDGESIFAPAGEDASLRLGLVVQASLVAAGSLHPQLVARLIGRPRSGRRYLTLEAARAVELLGDWVPRPAAELISRNWDGPLSDSPQESLKRALSPGEEVPEAPDWFGTIRPSKLLRKGVPDPGAESAEATGRNPGGTSGRAAASERSDEEEGEEVKILNALSGPLGLRMPAWLREVLGVSESPARGGASGAGELPTGGAAQVERVGHGAKPTTGAPGRRREIPQLMTRGRRYPEWDWRKRAYRQEWCSVSEFDPRPGEIDPGLEPGADLHLRKELARLGLAYERHRRRLDGEDLDPTALVEYLVDKATGSSVDERIYESRLRTAHDLGVMILLDATGSTGQSAEGQLVFDEQRRLVAQLTAVLDELDDRVATFAFRSNGRENVQFLRIKEFDDRFDHAALRRMAGLEPSGFTRLGAAIRHGVHLAETKAGTTNLLLIVVADGLPFDPDRYEGAHAERDVRRALDEAVAGGVGCACVSVRSGVDDAALERVWGNVPHCQLAGVDELASRVRPLFRAALRAAAASPRRRGGTVKHAA